jgi:predicted nucleotidyltransferase
MNRKDVIRVLKEHRHELAERFGVKSLALFGSVVRDESTDRSDVDLLVEFDDRPMTLFHLAQLQQHLEDLLGVERVDLVMRDSIYPALRENILREAVDVT